MNSKEKADELFDKLSWAMVPDGQSVRTSGIIKHAKKCVIICVEQIIEVLEEVNSDLGGTTPTIHDGKKWIPAMSYYESVLEHIKNK